MKNNRIWLKILAVIFLTVLLIGLINLDKNTLQKKQPKGELVRIGEVEILAGELAAGLGEEVAEQFAIFWESSHLPEDSFLTYGQYLSLLDFFLDAGITGEGLTYSQRYRDEFGLIQEDWQKGFEELISLCGMEERIRRESLVILCGADRVKGTGRMERTEPVEETQLVQETGLAGEKYLLDLEGNVIPYEDEAFSQLSFTRVEVYRTQERLLTLLGREEEMVQLSGALILEADEEALYLFYKGWELELPAPSASGIEVAAREQIGDLYFQSGHLSKVEIFDQRISGKLLSVSGQSLELEGYGSLAIDEDCVGYRLYEELSGAEWSDLAVGYDFADFAIKDGKVQGFLILRREKMETIRVALHKSGYGGIYQEEIRLSCADSDMTVSYGPYENRRQEKVAKGETLLLQEGSDYLDGDRVEIKPEINAAAICVESLQRSQGTPFYRGKMEVLDTPEGMVLINEVLLEEYLYSVVPSEMPASYPDQALQAQAICARTYACRYLSQPGYGALGAHVDDSVGYQVYNNIEENVHTTRAVRETTGMLLAYQEQPVSTYYYSTSCGFGTDAGVWAEENRESMPYLRSTPIAASGESLTPVEVQEETCFREYITSVQDGAWEKEEPWHRWSYTVEELSAQKLWERLAERYQAAPDKVLTAAEEGYVSREPKEFRKVRKLECLERGEGGVMSALLLETDQGTYKVLLEYNIRYVLNQGGVVYRQDGSAYESAALLPSAYLVIDVVKSGKNVVGYKICGGGYGHGVGMSQNGAKAMALAGKSREEILAFFYEGCEMVSAY